MKGRLLVVEDDAVVRAFEREALEDAGYRVVEAADGVAALDAIEMERFDAILLDLGLPDLDGLEVMRRLGETPAHARTPVLVTTGRHDPDGVLREVFAGASDHLPKPFTAPALAGAVERLLAGDGVQERRGALWRSALVYSMAGALRATVAGSADGARSRRTIPRR